MLIQSTIGTQNNRLPKYSLTQVNILHNRNRPNLCLIKINAFIQCILSRAATGQMLVKYTCGYWISLTNTRQNNIYWQLGEVCPLEKWLVNVQNLILHTVVILVFALIALLALRRVFLTPEVCRQRSLIWDGDESAYRQEVELVPSEQSAAEHAQLWRLQWTSWGIPNTAILYHTVQMFLLWKPKGFWDPQPTYTP